MAVGALHRVPAGGAFAVDRERFSAEITRRIEAHPRIRRRNEQVSRIPDAVGPVVIATGPLTGDALAADLQAAIGEAQIAYYDAIAPIVSAESIDWDRVFRASRWDKGGDAAYVNCPMDEAQYRAFVRGLVAAEKVQPREFEKMRYFEGCLPIEVIAERGELTLAHGCMKPVGLEDPRTGAQAFAVVQLRAEDDPPTAYNLVGFQTRMTWPEQRRLLRTIPGLEQAEFLRLGNIHRNTFVNAPAVLAEDLSLRARPGVHLAGQITGVEGYVESAASGLVLGILLAARIHGQTPIPPPPSTALGALLSHLRRPSEDFQPSNIVWSMFPPLEGRRIRRRRLRREALAARALEGLQGWLEAIGPEAAPGG